MRQASYVVVALVFAMAWGTRAEAGQSSCGLFDVPVSSSPTDHASLRAVSGVWAVGYSTLNPAQPLVEELNGNSWSPVSTPVPPNSYAASLNGLAASASNDVWAVGGYNVGPLIEHWDGGHWSLVAGAPSVTGGLSTVAVNRYNAKDVWAAGGTFAEHWNGAFWKTVNAPHGSQNSFEFTGVSVTSTGHVWLVGTNFGNPNKARMDFFDGTSWHQVQGAFTDGVLNGVAALKDDDVWVVGGTGSAIFGPFAPVIEHWDGTSWSIVPTPMPSGLNGQFYGVSARNGNVWVAGTYDAFGSSDVNIPVVMVSRLGKPWIDVTTSSEVVSQRLRAIAALDEPRGHGVEAVGDGVDASGAFSLYAVAGSCVI